MILTSYFFVHHNHDLHHVLISALYSGWTWHSRGLVTTVVAAVSLLSETKPTRHHPQQLETPPFDPHPEHDDPTMPMKPLPEARHPVSAREIHPGEGPCFCVWFPTVWLHTVPPRSPCHHIFELPIDGWNCLVLTAPLQPPCNFLWAASCW